MANSYDYGDLVRCTGTFTNLAGAAVDPDVVLFDITKPGGAKVTYTYGVDAGVVKSATGIYYYDVSCTVAGGDYQYRFHATGAGQAAGPSSFAVPPSEFD